MKEYVFSEENPWEVVKILFCLAHERDHNNINQYQNANSKELASSCAYI